MFELDWENYIFVGRTDELIWAKEGEEGREELTLGENNKASPPSRNSHAQPFVARKEHRGMHEGKPGVEIWLVWNFRPNGAASCWAFICTLAVGGPG